MCTHEMKRDEFVFRALVLIFMLNCGLILQRHDVGSVSNQDTPCNPDVVLEIPEQLNETLAADTKTRIAGFYHLAMMGPWKEIFYDQMLALRAKGLLNHSEFLFINAVCKRSQTPSGSPCSDSE